MLLGATLALGTLQLCEAASFNYRVYTPGLTTAQGSGPSAPATPTLSLAAAPLPPAMLSQSYSFDLSALLTSSAAAGASPASVSWSTLSPLPAGLTLDAGRLSGTPLVKDEAGTSVQVAAAYQGLAAQQVYTLVVNGVALQVTSLSAGARHTCAVTPAGAAKCWGLNTYGQLGDGTTTTRTAPTQVFGLETNVLSIAAGPRHSCALLVDSTVRCWGSNHAGELGNGTTSGNAANPAPVLVSGLSNVAALSLPGHDANNGYRSCALLKNGSISCWGNNAEGSLGDGTTTGRATPVSVVGVSTAIAVSVGAQHSCALLSEGGLKCWGNNLRGALGDGTTTASSTPVAVAGLGGIPVAVSAGWYHTCAVLAEGAVKCWGYGNSGRLGDGTSVNRNYPVPVTGLPSGALPLLATTYRGSCVALSAGGATCWGGNETGQLGDGTQVDKLTAVPVKGITRPVSMLVAGSHHACALVSGIAKCWGGNEAGQLGDGTQNDATAPVAVKP